MAAAGYEAIEWQGQQAYAKPGQFILRLDDVHGRADQQLNAVNKLLGHARHDAKATKFLGADGLTLVQTPKELTHGQLQAALRNVPGFRSLEPDFAVTTAALANDEYFSLEWGLHNTGQSGGKLDADIDAPEAWDITRGDGSVVVGVIDSGIDYTHPDLAGAIWTNPNEKADGVDNDGNGYVDDLRGWDFFNNDNNPMDDNGHGTHVAGTIAATADNGFGVAGVAKAKVMALKFLGADGTGSTSAAIAAVNYATQMKKAGVNIPLTNNSWGSGGGSTELYNAIKANADAGMLFVAAAGNGGADHVGDNNDTTPNYPANYNLDNIVSVAATDRLDNRGSFSNYGATTVDLAAPGVTIASLAPNGGYVYMDGTSMASPHVAGAAALAFSYNKAATAAQVKSALLGGVDPVASMSGRSVTGGRLNAHRTLQLLAPATTTPEPTPTPTPTPTLTAPAAPSNLVATAGPRRQVSLTWADHADNEAGFRIERSLDGRTWSEIGTVGADVTAATNSGVSRRTTYYYRIRAYNAAGESSYSAVATVRTT